MKANHVSMAGLYKRGDRRTHALSGRTVELAQIAKRAVSTPPAGSKSKLAACLGAADHPA